MKLKNLKLVNFRSYEDIFLDFSPGINIFIGDNGSGKTNILEAIYVLSLTKSNRIAHDLDLIKTGFNKSIITGEVLHDDYVKKYQVSIDKFSKKVYINNFQIKKISEYISNFCITSFLPNDIEIIKGSPSIRRNLLNIQIGEIYNHYLKYLNEYNTLLKMRNEYLKRLNINAFSDMKYLEVINEKMASISSKIYYFRFFYLEEINNLISKIYYKLSGIKELKVEYVNNLGITSYNEEKIKEILLTKWKKNLNKEMLQGMTLTGLHRDDLIFSINNQDARIYASQGQQRLIVIAYKIAELMIFKKIKGEYPVLLLDDVFSEIDIKKRNNIIKFLKSDIQVIITTTDIEDISKDLVDCARVFKIKNGEIKIKGGVKNGRKSTRKL
ncbi:MAG: DNA replication/repair protein RecF [Bacilli bacterium]|nr:DNA replication/repair protein RecF [Bacilli bacterium]